MTLGDYLKVTKQSASAFARAIGERPTTVCAWVRDERLPRPRKMRVIYERTGGCVYHYRVDGVLIEYISEVI